MGDSRDVEWAREAILQEARDPRPNSLGLLRDRIKDLRDSASRPDDLESDERVREFIEVHDLVRDIMKLQSLAVMLYVDTGEYRRRSERTGGVSLTSEEIGRVHGRLGEMLRTVDRLAGGLGIDRNPCRKTES